MPTASDTSHRDVPGGSPTSPNLGQVVPALVEAITSGVLADAPVGILAVDAADLTVAAVNRAFARQADARGVVGRPFGELLPPAVRPQVDDLVRRVVSGDVAAATFRCRCVAEGAESWAVGRLVAVRDPEGNAGLLLGYCDVCDTSGDCDRFEWEEVAAVTSRPGNAPLLLLADASWRVRSVCEGAQLLFEGATEEVIGTRIADLVHPDDLPALVGALAEVTSLHRPHAPIALRLQRADGSWAETFTAVTPLIHEGETSLGLVIFAEGSAVQTEVGHRLAELERSVSRLVEEFERNRPSARNPVLAALEELPGAGLLSGREREVLELVAEGYRVSTIARELFVSPSTIRNHLSAIFRKLGVGSQAELLERLRSLAAADTPRP